ncbi:MAG TPA: hypothetical protein VGK97_00050 [Spongiibacteraceae bacterium]|jgi:hypothetical protein
MRAQTVIGIEYLYFSSTKNSGMQMPIAQTHQYNREILKRGMLPSQQLSKAIVDKTAAAAQIKCACSRGVG